MGRNDGKRGCELGGYAGELVHEAFALIRAKSPEAAEKTEGAIAALKQKFV